MYRQAAAAWRLTQTSGAWRPHGPSTLQQVTYATTPLGQALYIQYMYRTKWRWKGVGVGEEELTENYIIVVVAYEMGHGIILIAVAKSQ